MQDDALSLKFALQSNIRILSFILLHIIFVNQLCQDFLFDFYHYTEEQNANGMSKMPVILSAIYTLLAMLFSLL